MEVLDCEELDCVAKVGNPNEGKMKRNVVDGVDKVEVVGDNVEVDSVDVGVEKVEVEDSLDVGIRNGIVGAKNGKLLVVGVVKVIGTVKNDGDEGFENIGDCVV